MPPEATVETPVPTTPEQTSSPASTPETTSPAPDAPPSEGSPADAFAGFDFKNMDFADETGETVVVDNTQTEPGTPAAPVQPAQQPAPPAQAVPVQPVAPVPPVVQPVAPTPAPTPQTPPSSVAPEDPYLAAWNQQAEQLDSHLQGYYALDDATAEALLENPKEVLPKILAKAHMAILQNTYKAVLDRLPPLMQANTVSARESAKAEERFFKAWPILKSEDPVHTSTAMQYGAMYRQQNPQATEQDFIKFVGAATAAHLGLKMPANKANGKGKPLPYAPAAQSAPSSGSGEPAPTQFEDMFNVIVGGQE